MKIFNLILYTALLYFYPNRITRGELTYLTGLESSVLNSCDHDNNTCRITFNKGGYYIAFINTFDYLSTFNYKVIVDGMCASGCTYMVNDLYLTHPKNVCITKNALFGIHAAYNQENTFNLRIPYVGKLKRLIDSKGGIPRSKDLMILQFKDLRTIYPVCP